MLDLARHIVEQKSGSFEPGKFEDQYETALVEIINQKRAGKPIAPKERPKGENVVSLMEALRRSVSGESPPSKTEARKKSGNKLRKTAAGQKEMLMPIAGKKPAKEAAAKKSVAGRHRSRHRLWSSRSVWQPVFPTRGQVIMYRSLLAILVLSAAPAFAEDFPPLQRAPVLEETLSAGQPSVKLVRSARIRFAPRQPTGLHRHPVSVVGVVTAGTFVFKCK